MRFPHTWKSKGTLPVPSPRKSSLNNVVNDPLTRSYCRWGGGHWGGPLRFPWLKNHCKFHTVKPLMNGILHTWDFLKLKPLGTYGRIFILAGAGFQPSARLTTTSLISMWLVDFDMFFFHLSTSAWVAYLLQVQLLLSDWIPVRNMLKIHGHSPLFFEFCCFFWVKAVFKCCSLEWCLKCWNSRYIVNMEIWHYFTPWKFGLFHGKN